MIVEYKADQRIAHITLNRPHKRNALNGEMVDELTAAFQQAQNDPEVKVVILSATGDVFSAGADLEYLQQLQQNSYQENLADSAKLMELFRLIYTLDKVVIAKVQGHAIAGGCGLATVCDLVITQPEAKFGYTEVRIGFVPAIVMVFLLRRLGEGHARDLLLSGQLLQADGAMKIGLVNKVVAADQLETEVEAQASKLISGNASESMKRVKRMISKIAGMELNEALNYAVEQNALARDTAECKQGIKAFLEKKQIEW